VLKAYPRTGLGPYRQRWQQRDVLHHQQVAINDNSGTHRGRALGIDGDGAYLLETSDGTLAVTSGRLRLEPGS